MNVLLSLLQKSTDYNQLLKAVEAKQAVAVSGLSQAPRSHVLAAVHEQSGRPLIAVCQDDMAAKRLASELGAFLGEEPPVLPSRELTLAGAIGVSRQWEQQRLRLLYALAQGRVPVLVASLDALLLRTIPRQTLFSASVTLRVGAEYSMPDPGGLFPCKSGRGRGTVRAARRHFGRVFPRAGKAAARGVFRRRTGHHGLF